MTTRQLDRRITDFIRRHSRRTSTDSEFNALAIELFRYQYGSNRWYRRFCQSLPVDVKTVTHWRQIPAIPTQAFKEFRLTTFPPRNATRVFKTSGTTRRETGAHYFDTLMLYETSLLEAFRQFVARDADRLEYFFLAEDPKYAVHSSLSHMMGVIRDKIARAKNRFFVRRGQLLSEELFRALKAARRPVCLFATSFSLKAFLEDMKLKNRALRLFKRSRILTTGGFKGRTREVSRAGMCRMVNRILGVDANHCLSEYGMTELSSQFYEANRVRRGKSPRYFQGPAWTRCAAVSPVTGRALPAGSKGLLRVWDLANRGSVCAVQTEDLVIARENGFSWVGRAPDAVLRGCSLSYEELFHG